MRCGPEPAGNRGASLCPDSVVFEPGPARGQTPSCKSSVKAIVLLAAWPSWDPGRGAPFPWACNPHPPPHRVFAVWTQLGGPGTPVPSPSAPRMQVCCCLRAPQVQSSRDVGSMGARREPLLWDDCQGTLLWPPHTALGLGGPGRRAACSLGKHQGGWKIPARGLGHGPRLLAQKQLRAATPGRAGTRSLLSSAAPAVADAAEASIFPQAPLASCCCSQHQPGPGGARQSPGGAAIARGNSVMGWRHHRVRRAGRDGEQRTCIHPVPVSLHLFCPLHPPVPTSLAPGGERPALPLTHGVTIGASLSPGS